MISKLTIRNFQAHKSLSLEFAPGITTIIGPSDVGKSAIIRCLQWICFNSPSGISFIAHGQEKTKAILEVDGSIITRTRSSDQNKYGIDDKQLKAFKTEVPAEIQAKLNVSELNFQNQHASPFWFAETAGEVSRQLNRIVDLTAIDNVLGSLASRLRSVREQIKLLKSRIGTINERVILLSNAPKLNKRINELVSIENELALKSKELKTLEDLSLSMEIHTDMINSSSRTLQRGNAAVLKGETWKQLRINWRKLEYGIHEVESCYKITKTKIPDITSLLKKKEKKLSLNRSIHNLGEIIEEIESANEKIKPKDLEILKKELEGIACPLCGRI
jgi:DNA repair ATPase RecN